MAECDRSEVIRYAAQLGMLHVDLHGFPSGRRIFRFECLINGLVLLKYGLEVVAGISLRRRRMLQISLIYRKGLAYHAVLGAGIDDIVELGVEREYLLHVIAESVEFHEFYCLGKLIDVLAGHSLDGPFDRLDLEEGPEIEEVRDIAPRETGNEGAAVRDVLYKTVRFKLTEGLSYRSPADVVLFAYRLFGKLAAVGYRARQYAGLELGIKACR